MASGMGTPSPSRTCPSISMRSPLAAPPWVRSAVSARSSPTAKNGPTVCDGVGMSFTSRLHGRRGAAAQHEVEAIAQSELCFAQVGIVGRDHPLARILIGDAVEDGIERQQRI